MDSLRMEQLPENRLDKFNYYGDFVQLPLLLAADFYYLNKYYAIDLSVVLAFIIAILFYGAFLEYGFHRYIYHGNMSQIKRLHLIHHKFPQSYVSSPPYVTSMLMLIFYVIAIELLGYKLGCAVVAGITFGYLWYISIHHFIHHSANINSSVLNHFKESHQLHHEHAKINYCVSQPFWNTVYTKLGQRYRKPH